MKHSIFNISNNTIYNLNKKSHFILNSFHFKFSFHFNYFLKTCLFLIEIIFYPNRSQIF